MFLPLGTDRPLHRPTLVNHLLIATNVAVYALVLIGRAVDQSMLAGLLNALALEPGRSGVWTWVTYAFVHDHHGFMHIAGNMLFLWVFGPNVEDRFGRIGYLIFYLLGCVVSAAAFALFHKNQGIIGASGAVAAVTGAYLVLFPRTHIKTLVFLLFIGIFMIPAPWFIGAKVFWDFVVTGTRLQGNVATEAHLGGYAFGFGVAIALLATKAIPREPYDLFTLGKQAHRRRQFKEASLATERAQAAGKGVHRAARARARKGELPEAAVEARADVARLVDASRFDEAGRAYRALLDQYGHLPTAGILGRRPQLELCKGLYSINDHDLAAVACERFVQCYGTDAEASSVKLMLGLLNARYLNDPVRAKVLLRESREEVRTDQERRLADQLLEELG